MDDYTLERKIRDIVDRNAYHVEYEGYTVNKEALIYEMIQLIKNDKRGEKKDTGGSGSLTEKSRL